jgi:hypothetical protein
MTNVRQQQDLLFKPLVVAGLVIAMFSFSCFWIANLAQLKQESDGFKTIGYRFLLGGIISIIIGFVSKYYYSLSAHGRHFWNQRLYKRGGGKSTSKFSDWYRP